ncbi:MAG: TIR domain-containing protein [Clostridiales bacterium]|nr:TIR domain-containing protein [Clostridiales bacterium]
MVIKCKMCGGDLNITAGDAVCECEYCGTTQTIPQADSEKKANLFNRANKLRMNADFDKAATVYASITAEFPEEAEAYWGLCLCKYGIEYVDDPLTGKKIPTCHRTLSNSILEDSDYDQARENADPVAKRLYRDEAKEIDRIQKAILDIVEQEPPYDVFICYKETDDEGNRTEDSVLAQDIYDNLTGKGLRVFFARISLEDKIGEQYEPYIYAALLSSKVMLAVGTDYEYFDAVWVKNEWARFLDMMKTDRTKKLIPCYKDIDAYDMPKEFKNLQAQDMGKLGWEQDLARGVMKLCSKDQNQQSYVDVQNLHSVNPTADSLLRRAMVFLEDGLWDEARKYADRILDLEVENGQAYLVKLMADLKITREEELRNLQIPFDTNDNYRKIIRFGSDELKSRIEGYSSAVLQTKETLERRIAEIEAGYNAEEQAYEEILKKDELIEETAEKIGKIQRDISACKRQKESLIGLFDGKKRNEVGNTIQALQKELESLEQEKIRLEEEQNTAEETVKPDKKKYYYDLGSAFFEARRYDEAYQYYNQIRGYADVNNRIQELSAFVPNAAYQNNG